MTKTPHTMTTEDLTAGLERALRADLDFAAFLGEVEQFSARAPELYLVRGAVRDFYYGVEPDDYDLMLVASAEELETSARALAFHERTYFGGFRRQLPRGMQVDLFAPTKIAGMSADDAVLRMMSTFEVSCDAMAYGVFSGRLLTNASTFRLFQQRRFRVQEGFLRHCSPADLAYVGVKAIEIMGKCSITIVDEQAPLICEALGMIAQGRIYYIAQVIERIQQSEAADGYWDPVPISIRRSLEDAKLVLQRARDEEPVVKPIEVP